MLEVPLPVVIGAIAASYALGTIPAALLVAGRRGVDPTAEGSGNPGASNVYRLAGRRAGLAVLAIDLAKGLVPALLALVAFGRPAALACGVGAVLGHVVPVTRGLRGGKGVATAGGVAVALWPVASGALVVVFLVVARLARTASVASLAMALGLPVGVALLGRPGWEVAGAAGLTALVVVRHAGNIRRLVHGEEPTIESEPLPPSLE